MRIPDLNLEDCRLNRFEASDLSNVRLPLFAHSRWKVSGILKSEP